MHLRDVQEIAEETVRQPMVQAQKVQSQEVVEDARLDGVVSFQAELPLPLQEAMAGFIETCPNWDQYRLIKAALAGFLVQNGVDSREITRLYVANMFRSDSLMQGF
ncbi:hypothetical protein PMIT1313_01167 [Prochlorococcus marinus str. MIT 1313]|nr:MULTISPECIES: DUF2811 domain-containing protein [Prochlorococcus]KZR75079.1 hypothetical protein PMIT1320_01711 [Prochlorococcus marinus str. MIT 1320]KZR82136.1 hypothetical protein PMIT1327_00909 [Prochlorococcus marinus str. MIT 1327]MCH2566473.1 DUF2811 domain-containing protein [Prochlorococcus sp. ALOHA_A2.0_51]CAI8266601.1 MAG: Uncharacterised protein [Prochlorococcus marinus str. MIT 9313]KZR65863.1 hypothetical protein PMIT1312_01127 [Prochlorococcus marinus str. MIT 1312]